MIHQASPFKLCDCGQVHRVGGALGDPVARALKGVQDMYVAPALKNLILIAVATASATNPDFASLHTAYSTSGASEVTSTSPAYARKAITWSSPLAGSTALNGTLPAFDVATGQTAMWVGFWDAVTAGTFLGMQALGGQAYKDAMCEAADITSNFVFCDSHGYVLDNRVVFWPIAGIALPGGIAQGTVYWVVGSPTTDSFQVSATQGGSAIDLTDPGTTTPYAFLVQRCIPQTTVTQDVISIASLTFDANLLN